MKNAFGFYKAKWLFFVIGIPFAILLFVFLLLARSGDVLGYIMSGVLFFILLFLIHRFFLIKITFEENKIIYKSLFKKIEIKVEDVNDIVIVEKQRRSAPEFEEYYDGFEPEIGLTSYFIMIGNLDYYPSNPQFLITSPVKSNYITLQYQDDLKEPLRKLLNR